MTLNGHELTVNFIILILWFTFLNFFSFVQIFFFLVILNSMWKMVLMEIGLFLTFLQGTEISIQMCGNVVHKEEHHTSYCWEILTFLKHFYSKAERTENLKKWHLKTWFNHVWLSDRIWRFVLEQLEYFTAGLSLFDP